MIDVVLHLEAVVNHVLVETGFDATEERAGHDKIISGQLFISPVSNAVDFKNLTMYNNNNKNSNKPHKYELPCNNFIPVAKFGNNGQLDYVNKIEQGGIGYSDKVKCLRIKVTKGQSNWIMIRLIQIETQ